MNSMQRKFAAFNDYLRNRDIELWSVFSSGPYLSISEEGGLRILMDEDLYSPEQEEELRQYWEEFEERY